MESGMKKFGTVLLLILALGFAWMLYSYLSYRSNNAVSDAAFVKSDAIYTLGFKVGGKIDHMLFTEGQKVSKERTIATIDPTDYQITKERLEHSIKALEANLGALREKRKRIFAELGIKTDISKNNISVGDEKEKALRFKIRAMQAQLQKAQRDRARYRKLLTQKLISKADFEKADTAYKTLHDQIDAAQKELDSYIKSLHNVHSSYKLSELEATQIKELDLSIKSLEEQIKANRKNLEAVTNKIRYCTLKSPIDGVIAKRFVNKGRVVSKGAPIYSVVDPNNKHVEVLLSEKKLHGVKPGNSVTITTEALHKRELKGVVESILPTSASTFSLVPRDIASGEFTKLDQRFVVRIAFKESEDLLRHILIGMGATVAIKRTADDNGK
ncbi:MAG: EmrA/EmrK family multidrug efflux transporter periplasmic adaptor subunit [Sulfurospirillum sp.]|nr:MAG: EmrA/EmrK family multidrug efflux transporter periplasmic adaptor subunit [Sulfurospirillum sp.]